ncbi:MAG: hypothetical protein GXP25_24425 [Planctomycetes bacterium]|nr:hypothetical protein [Planctomycetota bacterium]
MKKTIVCTLVVVILCTAGATAQQKKKRLRLTLDQKIDMILKNTKPLKFPRGDRLPLFFWHLHTRGNMCGGDEAKIEETLKALDARGLPVIHAWWHNPKAERQQAVMDQCMKLGKIQKRLGLPVYAFAGNTGVGFYRDKDATWHVDKDGNRFPDDTHVEKRPIGCPFAKDGWPAVADQVRAWVKCYRESAVPLDGVWFDWEWAGPSEWNGAWEKCRKCVRCQKELGKDGLKDFTVFQKKIREVRSAMQKTFVDVIHEYFPKATVANYGCYPMGDYRYWYDYYEKYVEGAPAKRVQRAVYRKWYKDEFGLTGYSIGMPVVYGWGPTYGWFDYADTDYRWFQNMLSVFSNSAANRPKGVPLVNWINRFVKLDTTPTDAVPISEEKYRELLWHIWLRGADSMYIWCRNEDILRELVPVHSTYAAALQYKEFLAKGTPLIFDVPETEGPVLSALRLGDRLLVRRTDFGKPPSKDDAFIEVNGKKITIPASMSGKTVVMEIK